MSTKLLSIATQIMALSLISTIGLLFVGLSFLILLHVSIVGKAVRRGSSTMSRAEDFNYKGGDGLSVDELKKLPCYDFSSGDDDCSVCLESFKKGEKCRLLPVCRHSFHAQCVDSWLVKIPICPVCRSRVGFWVQR